MAALPRKSSIEKVSKRDTQLRVEWLLNHSDDAFDLWQSLIQQPIVRVTVIPFELDISLRKNKLMPSSARGVTNGGKVWSTSYKHSHNITQPGYSSLHTLRHLNRI